MSNDITNFIQRKCTTMTRPPGPPGTGLVPSPPPHPETDRHEQRTGFTKVFRWLVPSDQKPPGTTVEVLGSFSGWRKIPLNYDPPSRTWQVIMNDIEGNRTHQYVILVDGKPSYDKTCDGLAAPQTP